MTDSVLDFDLVARSGHRASAAKLRCSGRRQHRGHFFLSCRTRTPTGFGPPVTALASVFGCSLRPSAGQAPRQPRSVPDPTPGPPPPTSFTVRGRGLVQHLLTQVLRCLFTPRADLAAPRLRWSPPPSPQEGGF